MAERLPVGAARNIKSPPFVAFGSNPPSADISSASIDRLSVQVTSQEPETNGSNGQLFSNGSSATSNRSSGYNKPVNLEVTTRNGSRTKEGESRHDTEWVEQDEPGVYITLTSLPGGVKDLKRVRFRYFIIIIFYFPFDLIFNACDVKDHCYICLCFEHCSKI